MQYHAGKVRATAWASANGRQVPWSKAVGMPMRPSHPERPYLKGDKVRRLYYRDKNCGKMHGALPLAIGMPMMLVDQADRSPEKQLLRGRVGRVVEIVVDAVGDACCDNAERQLHGAPVVAVLDFSTAEWHVEGMQER